jgi:lysozyme family protein
MQLSTLSDYTRDNIIAYLTGAVEKGYVNDGNDHGGETMYGITAALAAHYHDQLVSQFSWDGTMRNLPLNGAYYVYQCEFWNPMKLDQILAIQPLIAYQMFNVGINSGGTTAVKQLQHFLNLMNNNGSLWPDMPEDGNCGPTTVGTLQKYYGQRGRRGIQVLLTGLIILQGANYDRIGTSDKSQEVFEAGWLGRCTDAIGHYALLLGFAV